MEKTLMLAKIEGKRRRGWQRMRLLDCITYSMDMNLSKFWEIVKDRGAWLATRFSVMHISLHIQFSETPVLYRTFLKGKRKKC